MALLANLNRDPKKRARPYGPADFMPSWSRPEPQSAAQMKNAAKAFTLALGGRIERGTGGQPR